MRTEYDDYSASEYATAVAASAFAIHSLEEYQKDLRIGSGNPLSRVKTRKDQLSGQTGPSSTRRPYGQDNRASSSLRPVRSTSMNDQMKQRSSNKKPTPELRAEAWENNQMEKLKKRFDKINSDLLAWENEEKARAKLQLEKKKNELAHRKERFFQYYRVQLAKIDHIAQGAKKQVEDRRKFEGSAVKERAKKLRSARKSPPVCCFCF